MFFLKKQSYKHYKKFFLSYVIILLIPIIIIGTINYIIIREQYFSSLEKSINFEAHKQNAFLSNQLQIMNTIVFNCKRDKLYNSRYQANPINTYFDILNDIKNKEVSVAMFSRIYYYNVNEDYIISANGKYVSSYFFSRYINMNINTWKTIGSEKVPYSTFTAIKTTNVEGNQNSVMLVAPLEVDHSSEQSPVSFLIFEIIDSEFGELFSSASIHPDFIVFLYFNGKPIYSNNSEYNSSISENQNIQKLLDNKEKNLLYQYLDNSTFSIKWMAPKFLYIQILLKAVLIQGIIMLFVLGIGFWVIFYFLQRNYNPIKHIIQNVSKRYRHAEEVADEFKYIDFVINDLICAKELLEESNHELKIEKYLYIILSDQVQKGSDLYYKCLDEGVNINKNYFVCMILDYVTENQKIDSFLTEEFSKQFLEVSLYSLHIAKEKYLYLLCSDQSLHPFMENINGIFKSAGLDDLRMGAGKIVNDISEVNSSYLSAQSVLMKSAGVQEHAGEAGPPNYPNQVYPSIEIEAMREAVSTGNLDKIEFAMSNIKNVVKNNSMVIVNVAIYTEIVKILTAPDLNEYTENILQMENTGPEMIAHDLERLYKAYIAKKHGSSVERESAVKNQSYKNIGEIVKYIKENYQHNFFSVKYMAMEFGTTSSNLSHYFKKCTGQNISQFIDELKIQRAKILLEDNRMKISDIANQLGYNSTSVFIESFKKYEGITPGMYRSNKNRDFNK